MRSFLLRSFGRFAAAVLATWLVLFVLLDLLPGAGSGALPLPPLGDRLAVTLPLVLLAGILALLIGAGIAVAAAWRGGWLDRGLGGFAAALSYLPPFWLGLLLALLLSGTLRLLPAGGFVPWGAGPGGALASLVLPALALGLPHAGQFAIWLRGLIGPEPAEAELLPLRIAGLSHERARWTIGYAHALPQLPRLVGRVLAALLIGAVVVENVFYLPGLGQQVLGAAVAHDLPLLRASLFLLLVLAALFMLLATLSRLAIDPALRATR